MPFLRTDVFFDGSSQVHRQLTAAEIAWPITAAIIGAVILGAVGYHVYLIYKNAAKQEDRESKNQSYALDLVASGPTRFHEKVRTAKRPSFASASSLDGLKDDDVVNKYADVSFSLNRNHNENASIISSISPDSHVPTTQAMCVQQDHGSMITCETRRGSIIADIGIVMKPENVYKGAEDESLEVDAASYQHPIAAAASAYANPHGPVAPLRLAPETMDAPSVRYNSMITCDSV